MKIWMPIVAFAGLATLVAGGAFAWRWWIRVQNIASHGYLTQLDVGMLNLTCEMCHRAETELYRGDVKTSLVGIRKEWKGPVVCTDCHDFVSRKAVGEKCVECHKASYLAFLAEWETGFDEEVAVIGKQLNRAQAALAGAPRESRPVSMAERRMREAREALEHVKRGRGAHHPDASHALLRLARQKAKEVLEITARR